MEPTVEEAKENTAVIAGSTNELRLTVYACFMVRTVELKKSGAVWLTWLDISKN